MAEEGTATRRVLDIHDRQAMVRVGFIAVFMACAVFAPARLAAQLATGQSTPWWVNVAGAVATAALYVWYARAPEDRGGLVVHAIAAIATIALVVPVAYGMTSTIWWLALVGFATALMGTRREAVAWSAIVLVAVLGATFFEDRIRMADTLGETPFERDMARVVFIVILMLVAYGFRQVFERRAQALARAQSMAEQESRAKSRFLAHMSHELRTPLNGVLAMTELAMASEQVPESEKSHLRTAHTSGTLLLRLIEDVLETSRLGQGTPVVREVPFDLHRALTGVLVPLAHQADAEGLQFEATAEAGLPCKRLGDPVRVGQIAVNLVGNALKFTRRGSVKVRLLSGDTPEQVRIEVTDTGQGIAAAHLEAICRPFTQAVDGDGRHAGTGLGLTIARQLAVQMGGDLAVRSTPGRGSTFTATLVVPITSDRTGPEDLLVQGAPSLPPGPRRAGTPLRVLVVDDDRMNRQVLARVLRSLGHGVEVSVNGQEALERCRDGAFDVVLADLEMPVMGGLELTRRLREAEARGGRRVAIAAVSAHVSGDWVKEADEAGMDAFIAKPYDIAQIDRVLDQLVGV